MSKHRNYPYTTLWTDPLMDGWTGYSMDWIKDRQTKYVMDWPYGGNTERILYGLALQWERQSGHFMDWFTDGQTHWTGAHTDGLDINFYGTLAHKWNNPPSCNHFSRDGA